MSNANSATPSLSPKTPKRVKRGAKLLDSVAGSDWYWNVNLNTLKLEDCYKCVLGQLYGDFRDGIIQVAHPDDEIRCGFNIKCDLFWSEEEEEQSYKWLTDLWKAQIIKRREEDTGMNIGEEQPAIVVEPIDVPSEVPEESPLEVPVEVPDKEKVPA